jgi:hypothetical protein
MFHFSSLPSFCHFGFSSLDAFFLICVYSPTPFHVFVVNQCWNWLNPCSSWLRAALVEASCFCLLCLSNLQQQHWTLNACSTLFFLFVFGHPTTRSRHTHCIHHSLEMAWCSSLFMVTPSETLETLTGTWNAAKQWKIGTVQINSPNKHHAVILPSPTCGTSWPCLVVPCSWAIPHQY